MCLAIPVKIVSITDTIAEVDFGGNRTAVDISLVPEAGIGDYVIIHAGLAIQKYDEEEALRTLELLKELAENLERG
jgi:hydrogenase expression/formation protein HypC